MENLRFFRVIRARISFIAVIVAFLFTIIIGLHGLCRNKTLKMGSMYWSPRRASQGGAYYKGICEGCCSLAQNIVNGTSLVKRKNMVCFSRKKGKGEFYVTHLTEFNPVYGHYLAMAKKFLADAFSAKRLMKMNSGGELVWIIEDDCTIHPTFIKLFYELRIPFLAHSIEKRSRSASILVPNFHFIEKDGYRLLLKKLQKKGRDFSNRKPLIFWRGTDTGIPCGVSSLFERKCTKSCYTVQRVEMVKRSRAIPWIDARLTNLVQWCQKNHQKLFQEGIFVPEKTPEVEWINFRGILEIDGNVDAWGNRWRMQSGSIIFRVESPYIAHFTEKQISNVHYIPVSANLVDLVSATKIITSSLHSDVQKLENISRAAFEYSRSYTYYSQVEELVEKLVLIWSNSSL